MIPEARTWTRGERFVRVILGLAVVVCWIGWLWAGVTRDWGPATYYGVSILLLIRTREWLDADR